MESSIIGEFVMEHLKNLDDVAYVRFASVYRQFTDAESFRKEIEKLLKSSESKSKKSSKSSKKAKPAKEKTDD
jgi:transcriptional repressor NrdR